MEQPDAIIKVLFDHSQSSVIEQISPRQDLDLSVSDDQLLEQVHLLMAGVELLACVGLPLLKFLEEEFSSSQYLHQGCRFGVERRQHIVREEQHIVEDGTLILGEDVPNSRL